jgi:hypothetical protein
VTAFSGALVLAYRQVRGFRSEVGVRKRYSFGPDVNIEHLNTHPAPDGALRPGPWPPVPVFPQNLSPTTPAGAPGTRLRFSPKTHHLPPITCPAAGPGPGSYSSGAACDGSVTPGGNSMILMLRK